MPRLERLMPTARGGLPFGRRSAAEAFEPGRRPALRGPAPPDSLVKDHPFRFDLVASGGFTLACAPLPPDQGVAD